jgi:hypothetical protein
MTALASKFDSERTRNVLPPLEGQRSRLQRWRRLIPSLGRPSFQRLRLRSWSSIASVALASITRLISATLTPCTLAIARGDLPHGKFVTGIASVLAVARRQGQHLPKAAAPVSRELFLRLSVHQPSAWPPDPLRLRGDNERRARPAAVKQDELISIFGGLNRSKRGASFSIPRLSVAGIASALAVPRDRPLSAPAAG